MLLSICICTIASRKHLLARLLAELKQQQTDQVEILTDDDEVKTIGEKRNNLVSRCTGEYVVFIDDDDLVSKQYVKSILEALETKPDCVGISGIVTLNGSYGNHMYISSKYSTWSRGDKVSYRPPGHLSPIRTDIVKTIPFKHINLGEDVDFSNRLVESGLIKSEVTLHQVPLYHYLYVNKTKINRRDQSRARKEAR